MSEIIVNIKNMNEQEFAQVWDLLKVADVVAIDNNHPLQSDFNIDIDLKDNQHINNGALDDAIGYIAKHIIK